MQAPPKKFWFVKKTGKISKNLGKISETSGKNDAQYCLITKNGAQHFQTTQMKTFILRSYQKTSSWSLRKKLCRQKSHKNLSCKFGEILAKVLRIPRILPSPTTMRIGYGDKKFVLAFQCWEMSVRLMRNWDCESTLWGTVIAKTTACENNIKQNDYWITANI